MPILVDTTVLSNLAVVDRLDWLTFLSDTCYLASAVYDEVQRGLAEGYTFLERVDQALDSGQLLLTTLENEAEWQQYRAIPVKLQHGERSSATLLSPLLAVMDNEGYNCAIKSSTVTPACFKMLCSVPIANSWCKGTTHPAVPCAVCFFKMT